jgi:hypothetical protein
MANIISQAVTKILAMVEIEETIDERTGIPLPLRLEPEQRGQIADMRPTPEQIRERGMDDPECGSMTLGSYRSMQSPGLIMIQWANIGSFFWHIIQQLLQNGHYIQKSYLPILADTAVKKVYEHEKFHHFCDLAQHLFGTHRDRMKEEALAVAYAYVGLEALMRDGRRVSQRLPNVLYRSMLAALFVYSAPGYRDWHLYRTELDFTNGLVEYLLKPHTIAFLSSSNVDVQAILRLLSNNIGNDGFEETLSP